MQAAVLPCVREAGRSQSRQRSFRVRGRPSSKRAGAQLNMQGAYGSESARMTRCCCSPAMQMHTPSPWSYSMPAQVLPAAICGPGTSCSDRQVGQGTLLAQVVPLLQAMGSSILDCGSEAKAGAVMKLVGNFTFMSYVETAAEAMALADAGGLPRASLTAFLDRIFPGFVTKGVWAALSPHVLISQLQGRTCSMDAWATCCLRRCVFAE